MAKIHSYNNEIKFATAQLLDVFNDITIDRYDNAHNVTKKIRVPCRFGNRDRILKSLENRDKTVELPIIVITLNSIRRDPTRVMDVNSEIMYQDGTGVFDYRYKTPTPIDLKYDIQFIAKKTEDLLQLLSNWAVWFNPDIFVVTPNRYDPTQKLKSQVIWDGDFNVDMANDINPDKAYRVSGKSTFTFKSWLFVGTYDGDGVDGYEPKRINRINFNPNIIDNDDGHGARLSNWYDVPPGMSFRDHYNNILLGLVKDQDVLAMSGNVSGYWHDISGMVMEPDSVIDPMYKNKVVKVY